jgi:hypothetical protein
VGVAVRVATALVALICGSLGLPAVAEGHSIVRQSGGDTTYLSSDVVSLNTLEVSASGSEVRMYDPTAFGGIDPGTCRPGQANNEGYVIEVFCPRANTARMRIELGEREDTLTSTLDVPLLAIGGGGADTLKGAGQADVLVGNEGNDVLEGASGNDQLNGSEGDDTLRGADGNDLLQAGPGADSVEGGAGDDDVRLRDGIADKVACGDGADKVDADALDEIGADCETVTRPDPATGAPTAAPPGPQPAASGPDRTKPLLKVGGSTSQSVRARRVVQVLATSSERGTMATSGALHIGALALPVKSKVERVPTAGGGVTLRVRLTADQLRRTRRALKRGRRVTVTLDVVATDEAGNSTTAKAPKIRLRR